MEKISRPGVYTGYSNDSCHMERKHSVYVPMSDGVKLALDYYIPYSSKKEMEGAFPVVLIHSPYPYRKEFNDKTIPEEDQFPLGEKLVKRGYVFAIADVRGTGVSYGCRKMPNSRREGLDGYELIEWIAEQNWCDGNVGTAGFSYFGFTQLETVALNPPHLKGAFIGMTSFDNYDSWVRGGILRKFGTHPDADYKLDLNNPPVDEDIDGLQRLEAVEEHRFSNSLAQVMIDCPYRDSFSEKADCRLWETIARCYDLNKINKTKTKIYLYGGWRDVFRKETILKFKNFTCDKKMIIGDWCHMDTRPGFDMDLEHIRFFDFALKGIKNGVFEEEPIYYSTTRKEIKTWQFAKEWPPKATMKRFCMESAQLKELPENTDIKPEVYTARYDITENVDDMCGTSQRQEKGLVYTSQRLKKDMRITGHGIIHLSISSTAAKGDIFVSLIDVDEKGTGRYVTDGIQRLELRKVNENTIYDYGNLPWHRCNEEDREFLIPGVPVDAVFDFLPTSYTFPKNHTIQVAITTACDRFWFHKEKNPPVISIHHKEYGGSYIELPVCEEENSKKL